MNRFSVVAALICAPLFACGSEADHPLGGPHGSQASGTDPTSGSASGTPASGTDDTSSDGGTPESPGTPGAPGTPQGNPPGTPPGTPPTAAAPTWSYLVTTYFATGTIGHCGTGCHHHGSTFNTPAAAYTYMKGQGYITGTTSPLIDNAQSCLSWFGGGSMPPSGTTSSAAATKDFKAWVAAGAPNN